MRLLDFFSLNFFIAPRMSSPVDMSSANTRGTVGLLVEKCGTSKMYERQMQEGYDSILNLLR